MLKVFLSTIVSTFHIFWYVMTLFSLTAKYCQCPCYFFFEAIGYLRSCYLIYKHLVIFQISFSYSIFISNFNDGQETLYTIEILLFFFKLVLWPRIWMSTLPRCSAIQKSSPAWSSPTTDHSVRRQLRLRPARGPRDHQLLEAALAGDQPPGAAAAEHKG